MRIDLDHFETIEELERDLIGWIKEEDIYSFDRHLNKEDVLKIVQLLIKKENIIKEVRELVENGFFSYTIIKDGKRRTISNKELLEILDKVGDSNE